MNRFVRFIAKTTKSLTGQSILARNAENHSDLAENKHLQEQVWVALYSAKPKADLAEKLMKRELTPEQVDFVISKEKRIGVLRELVSHSFLNEEQGRALINKTSIYSKISRAWWSSGKVPNMLKGEVALDSCSMLEYALENDNLSDEAVLAIIRSKKYRNPDVLDKIIEQRKNLIDKLIGDEDNGIRCAAAASRHLFDQEAMVQAVALCKDYQTTWQFRIAKTILENPNASPETLGKVKDQLTEFRHVSDVLFDSLLNSRLLSSKAYADKPWEYETDADKIHIIQRLSMRNTTRAVVVRSLENLTLNRDYVRESTEKPAATTDTEKPTSMKKTNYAAIEVGSYKIPSEGVGPTVDWLSNELDIYGHEAWEAALMLLYSDYDGSLRNLVDSARII